MYFCVCVFLRHILSCGGEGLSLREEATVLRPVVHGGTFKKGNRIALQPLLASRRGGRGVRVCTRIAVPRNTSLNVRQREKGTRSCCVLTKANLCASSKGACRIRTDSAACYTSNRYRKLRGAKSNSLGFVTLVVPS